MTKLERNKSYRLRVPSGRAENWLYSAYDLELRSGDIRLEVGRFSYGIISRLRVLCSPVDQLVFQAGSFCEGANSAAILIGGEHQNESMFNFTFSSAAVFKYFMDEADLSLASVKPTPLTLMGDNVIVSHGAIVLAGSSIGKGSILGASSLSLGTLAPFGVYGGVPAKRLKDRFENNAIEQLYRNVRMGDVAAHCLARFPRLVKDLERGDITLADAQSQIDYLSRRPRIQVEIEIGPGGVVSLQRPTAFFLGEEEIVGKEAEKLRAYFEQAKSEGNEITWSPDAFDHVGLYD